MVDEKIEIRLLLEHRKYFQSDFNDFINSYIEAYILSQSKDRIGKCSVTGKDFYVEEYFLIDNVKNLRGEDKIIERPLYRCSECRLRV